HRRHSARTENSASHPGSLIEQASQRIAVQQPAPPRATTNKRAFASQQDSQPRTERLVTWRRFRKHFLPALCYMW
ncbi:MAG: hypothetical protein ACRETH_07330, partial [Steroidobacteraceae bacterium]